MGAGKPLVSIIVPVYCAEKYLPMCLDSLVRQDYKNLEIILVDDGSTDGSGVICDRYAEKDWRIQVIHQSNCGVAAARNRGVQRASGDYIAHVDADDWAEPGYIQYLLEIIARFDAEIAICGCKLPLYQRHRVYTADRALRELLYQRRFDTALWGKLFRADIVKNIPFPEGLFFEDLAVVCQMIGTAEYIACGGWQGYHYRHAPDGTMNGGHVDRLLDELHAADLMGQYILQTYPSAMQAANCRKFSAYCQTLMKLPAEGYEKERDQIWQYIRKTRPQILKDRCARDKNRIAAAASYLGENVMRFLWEFQNGIENLKS